MTVYNGTLVIAVLGVDTLTSFTFGPTEQSRQIAVLIPPWQADGLDRAATTWLALVDIKGAAPNRDKTITEVPSSRECCSYMVWAWPEATLVYRRVGGWKV